MTIELPLSLDQLRSLKPLAEAYPDQRPDWRKSYLDEVTRVRDLSMQQLQDPAEQERLWTCRGVTGVGMGDGIRTRDVYQDPQTIEAVVALTRFRDAPLDGNVPAVALQQAYNHLLGLVHPRLCKRRPKAKLHRLFLALIPEQLHCGISWQSQRHVTQLLLGRPSGDGILADAVRVRERLRLGFGVEETIASHVERSMMCWWLHRNFEGIVNGDLLNAERPPSTLVDVAIERSTGDVNKPLHILPPTAQRKGFARIGGDVEAIRAMLLSCRGGDTRDGAITTLREEHGVSRNNSIKHSRSLFHALKDLELIESRDGLWYPSQAGEEVLESEPPEPLIRGMLERGFGMALMLRAVEQHGPINRAGLLAECAALGMSSRVCDRALFWLSALDLIENTDGAWKLTEGGALWTKLLPGSLPAQSPEEATGEGAAPSGPVWTPPQFATFWTAFSGHEALRSFVFEPAQVRLLHLAWHSHPRKRFAILSGLSGTGKTALLQHYARVYCESLDLDPAEHCAIVAVSPDWRDPSGMLGYLNVLSQVPTFHSEPALKLLLKASQRPHEPHFLILDEMNLAPVERYFAPFLSSMETGERLVLHADDDDTTDVPQAIPWPTNLFLGGTVNMDETTHTFSDKVLDRAFTLEFWHVDLPAYFQKRRDDDAARLGAESVDVVCEFLGALNAQLAEVRRHVGYRAAGEVLDLLCTAAEHDLVPDHDALWRLVDDAVHAKVLPRLRGHRSDELERAFDVAIEACDRRALTRCKGKLTAMKRRLDSHGVTRFFA